MPSEPKSFEDALSIREKHVPVLCKGDITTARLLMRFLRDRARKDNHTRWRIRDLWLEMMHDDEMQEHKRDWRKFTKGRVYRLLRILGHPDCNTRRFSIDRYDLFVSIPYAKMLEGDYVLDIRVIHFGYEDFLATRTPQELDEFMAKSADAYNTVPWDENPQHQPF